MIIMNVHLGAHLAARLDSRTSISFGCYFVSVAARRNISKREIENIIQFDTRQELAERSRLRRRVHKIRNVRERERRRRSRRFQAWDDGNLSYIMPSHDYLLPSFALFKFPSPYRQRAFITEAVACQDTGRLNSRIPDMSCARPRLRLSSRFCARLSDILWILSAYFQSHRVAGKDSVIILILPFSYPASERCSRTTSGFDGEMNEQVTRINYRLAKKSQDVTVLLYHLSGKFAS